jgi:hypothetical protein
MKDGVRSFQKGQEVIWMWLGREIKGKVLEAYLEPVVREIKGKKIKRNGSPDRPAYLVQSEAGNLALKLHSELKEFKIDKNRQKKSIPKMFGD